MAERTQRIGHVLPVFETDGTQWIQAVMQSYPCGCTIEGGGTCTQPLRIDFCPMHAAATGETK